MQLFHCPVPELYPLYNKPVIVLSAVAILASGTVSYSQSIRSMGGWDPHWRLKQRTGSLDEALNLLCLQQVVSVTGKPQDTPQVSRELED